MDGVKIGLLIKEARERQGITQEELCGLAITPSTLSRIENGRVLPSRKNREYLCQKLGILESMIQYEPSKNDEEKMIIEKEIKKSVAIGTYNYSDLLIRYAEIMSEDSPLEKQFYKYASALKFSKETGDRRKSKEMLLEALSLTFPNFSFDIDLHKHYFSSLEITLMNCIALRIYDDDKNSALYIMRQLKDYCEMHLNPIAEIMNNYPTILFNVQNWEGFAENWEEAYNVASKGIEFCIENGNTFILPNLFIDKGWNAFQLGRIEEARKCIIEGCALLKARGDYDEIDSILKNLSSFTEQKLVISKNDF